MNVTINDHFLFIDGKQVNFIATPNKGGVFTPEYLIEHFTGSVKASGAISWFRSPVAKASAHLLIDRDGKVWQFAPFNVVTWHSGQSKWKDIIGLNSHAIGIEHVNAGRLVKKQDGWYSGLDNTKVADFEIVNGEAWQKYTDKQIQLSVAIAAAIVATYSIKEILGHEQIAPGRKIDPGPVFPWPVIRAVMAPPVKKATAKLNVRSGPGTDYMVVDKLEAGTPVKVLEEKPGWYYVGKGWVSAQFVA